MMIARGLLAMSIVLELVSCAGGDDRVTLDEVGAAQVNETCAELDEAMRNDDEAVEGLCRVYAANLGVKSSAPNVTPESAVSACETSFPTCPRQAVRSVCIDAYLDGNCDATLADLMACAERVRDGYRAHASETCTETVGQLLGMRTPPMQSPSTVCKRVFACFQPVRLFCPPDAGAPAMIFDADQLHFLDESQIDASAPLSCP